MEILHPERYEAAWIFQYELFILHSEEEGGKTWETGKKYKCVVVIVHIGNKMPRFPVWCNFPFYLQGYSFRVAFRGAELKYLCTCWMPAGRLVFPFFRLHIHTLLLPRFNQSAGERTEQPRASAASLASTSLRDFFFFFFFPYQCVFSRLLLRPVVSMYDRPSQKRRNNKIKLNPE